MSAVFPEIHSDEVHLLGEKLGKGNFGSIYKAQWRGEIVAVKIPVSRKEVNVHSCVSHENIVPFFGAFNDNPYDNSYAIVMEYATNGCLFDYLKQHPDGEFALTGQNLQWAEDIALGLNYLHNICVIHLDLKSPNVVLDRNYTAKICDFGCSRFYRGTELISVIGTLPWMSPEMIRREPVSKSTDVFAFGVVLWELVTHKLPWEGLEECQIIFGVGNGMRLAIPALCPELLSQMMQNCWKADPEKRITSKDILHNLGKMKEEVPQPVQEESQKMQSHLVVSTTRPPAQLYRQLPKPSLARTHPEAIDQRPPSDSSGGSQELNEPRPFCEPNDVPEMTEEEGHSLEQTSHDPPTTTEIVAVPTTVDDDVQQCVEEQGTGVKADSTANTGAPQHRYCPSYSV